MKSSAVIEDNGGLDYLKQKKLEGKTQIETATELGFSNSKLIYNYLKDNYNTTWEDLPAGEFKKRSINKLIYDHGGLSYIIRMKNKGYTMKEISEDLGYRSSVPLSMYLKRNNLVWKNLGHNRTSCRLRVIDNDNDVIREVGLLRDEGYSLHEICEYIGVTNAYLVEIFRRNDLSLKKFVYREHLTPIQRMIRDYGGVDYLNNKTIDEVAEEFGYSLNYTRSEVRKYLEGTGFKLMFNRIVKE